MFAALRFWEHNTEMTILRVEREGTGPYTGIGYSSLHSSRIDDDRHPTPEAEGLGGFKYRYIFGFASREQFEAWFNPLERKKLHELGYRLSTYSVPSSHVQAGKKQVCFSGVKAKVQKVEELVCQ